MRTLYLDCGMGAAGDMLTAALLELLPQPEAFVERLNGLGIPGVTYHREQAEKCGITGTHITVTVDGHTEGDHDHEHDHHHEHDHGHHHHHSGMEEIGHLIGHLPVSERVRADIRAVYDSIAQAESHVHGVPVTDIHFHEVGTMDAVADVTAVCLLMEELAADQVIASPVHVGSGTVRCAHGVLPVPAPATAYLLRDVPIYGGAIQGELCTPTGAALLRHFVTRFGDMPVMTLETVGYGMGQKDFPRANCLRAMLGETAAESGDVYELACNLDDMTGEGIAFAMERLLAAGALDVYTLPIGMKKSRPGVMLCVLCREEQREDMVHLLLRHTTTLGVRETRHRRYTLSRSQDTVDSPWGPVARKTSQGWGVRRQKPEFEDLAMRLAEIMGIRTVPHALIKMNDEYAYITKRIDREISEKETKLYAMEDFCQLSYRLTQDKYKGSYEQCGRIIKKCSATPGLDLSELFLRVVGSFVMGNSDMHLKNFSLKETEPGSRNFQLSKAYDMLPVNVIMPEDKEQLALTINGKKRNIHKKEFRILAESCGIPLNSAERMMKKVCSLKAKLSTQIEESCLSAEQKEQMEELISKRIDILS